MGQKQIKKLIFICSTKTNPLKVSILFHNLVPYLGTRYYRYQLHQEIGPKGSAYSSLSPVTTWVAPQLADTHGDTGRELEL